MPTFKNIDDFTLKSAATGTEEIQTSATEKINTQQIADLVRSTPMLNSEVTVTNFQAHTFTGGVSFSEIPNNAVFSFKAAASATDGPGVAVNGLGIKISSDTAIYFASSGSTQYLIQGVTGAGTDVVNLSYGKGLDNYTVTNFLALTSLLAEVPSGTTVSFRAANDSTNGPVSGAGSWGFILKIDNSTFRVIANIFGGTAPGWGYDMYIGFIYSTTTKNWSKVNGISELPDNVMYLAQAYVTEDPTTLWSELEGMTSSGSVSAGDFFPFKFNANTVSMPTTNAGHGFYQYGTNCAYAIIFEEVATGNGRAWFGHFESSDGAVEWTEIGGGNVLSGALTITNKISSTTGTVFGFKAKGDIRAVSVPRTATDRPMPSREGIDYVGWVQAASYGGPTTYNGVIFLATGSTATTEYWYGTFAYNGTITWTQVGGGSKGYEPVEITEYGAIYDMTTLNDVPAGAIVPWYANGSNVDRDYGPFGGESERTDGIYVAIKGSEDSQSREGVLVAFRTDGNGKEMAYVKPTGGPGIGGVGNANLWAVYNASSGGGPKLIYDGYELIDSTNCTVDLTEGIPANSLIWIELSTSDSFGGEELNIDPLRQLIPYEIPDIKTTNTYLLTNRTVLEPATVGEQSTCKIYQNNLRIGNSVVSGNNITRLRFDLVYTGSAGHSDAYYVVNRIWLMRSGK